MSPGYSGYKFFKSLIRSLSHVSELPFFARTSVFGFQTFLNDSLLRMSLNLRNLKVTNLLNYENNVIERNLIYKYIRFII